MHTHEHEHEHTHADGDVHSHTHSHEHTHSNETFALLKYASDHNAAHAAELENLAERLRNEGHSHTAEHVSEAARYLLDCGDELHDALHELGIGH
jgi:molecular chaperone GrpE (heat shock protein)